MQDNDRPSVDQLVSYPVVPAVPIMDPVDARNMLISPLYPRTPTQLFAGTSGGIPMGARPAPRSPTGEQTRLGPSQAHGGDLYDRNLLHPHLIRGRRLSKEDRNAVEVPGQATFHHTTDLDHALLLERGKVIQQVRAAANEDSVVLALVQKEHLSSMLTKSANDEEHLYVLSSLRKLLRWSRDA
ncbi:MAG: hypothetical protein GY696_19655, partial [Gammaproteobacteria bacterium]|nr:hypothetical protein [Gammaproteobacteria bacterium]